MTTRAYQSDQDSYEIYVGGMLPSDFVKGYLTVNEAVTDFIDNYEDPDGEETPSWLHDSLVRHIRAYFL